MASTRQPIMREAASFDVGRPDPAQVGMRSHMPVYSTYSSRHMDMVLSRTFYNHYLDSTYVQWYCQEQDEPPRQQAGRADGTHDAQVQEGPDDVAVPNVHGAWCQLLLLLLLWRRQWQWQRRHMRRLTAGLRLALYW